MEKYKFKFNNIKKNNEIAGIGNHYKALYGEYDPRTAIRWNLDPKPVTSISPYAMYKGNPIMYSDLLLYTVSVSYKYKGKGEKKVRQFLLVISG
jgi:alpha-glucosidase (family GH31 glycosyl hydrolase)